MSRNIRIASVTDLSQIDQIYNQAIVSGRQTADLQPLSEAARKEWFEMHSSNQYPIYVLVEGDTILGWSSISKYRGGRGALSLTAEVSYYLAKPHQGRGYGAKMLEYTISEANELGYQNLVAILLSSNERSIHLLKKFNFQEWGRMPQTAIINNKVYDHLYYGLKITH